VIAWRRSVVLSLGSILGLLLYCASRLVRGGATASLLCGAHIASKLGCTEITSLVDPSTPLRLLVDRCISSAAPSTSPPTTRSSANSAGSGRAGGDGGAAPAIRFTSKP